MSKTDTINSDKGASPEDQFYLEQAKAFEECGQWLEVVRCCESKLHSDPDSFSAYELMGNSLLMLERWQDSIAAHQSALEMEPDSAIIRHKIAVACISLNRFSDVDQQYNSIFDLEPDFDKRHASAFDIQRQCGDFFFRQHDWLRATVAYERATNLQPQSYWEHVNLGRAKYFLGELDQAVNLFMTAAQLDQDNGFTYYLLANVLVEQGHLSQASQYCKRARLSMSESSELLSLETKIFARQTLHNSFTATAAVALSSQLQAVAVMPNWQHSYQQGKQLQLRAELDEAVQAYHQAIVQNPLHSWSYHDLGDTYLKLSEWKKAISAYLQAISLNPNCFWSHYNLGIAYRRIEDWENSTWLFRKLIDFYPNLSLPVEALKETLHGWYDSLMREGEQCLSFSKRRALQQYRQAVQTYKKNIRLPNFECSRSLEHTPSVLLIVDDHLSQCLRYRVTQKLEQLEHAGFKAEWYSWTKIREAQNQLAFFDVVVFYRVPAFPDVIQTILYAKQIRKVVFYEIDDLIFDPEYFPAPIETYGGQVSQEQYDDLIKGTVLFQEAIRLCDLAIASTPPLQRQIELLIGEGNCYLHRNALDRYSISSLNTGLPKLKRDYISIFYGSGTKAHNNDFDELAAPALALVLQKYPNVRLTLMGYLKTPDTLAGYEAQIDRIGPVKDIFVYYEFLKQADISIAMLHPTVGNNCKSELKWVEAAIFKIPSVVSNTEVYLDAVKHGQDALVAASPDEWFVHLESLVKNEKLRHKIGQTAYRRVIQNYDVSTMANNLRKIITSGLERSFVDSDAALLTSRKKILIVNVFYPPQSIGGATRIVKDNVDVLKNQYAEDYEICVFTTDEGNPTPYQISEYTHEGIHVTKVSSPMMEGMDWQYSNPQMYEIFERYLAFNQPDLIHFHCIQRLTASVVEAASDAGIPYFVTVHDAWWISDHQFLVNEDGMECNYLQIDPVVAAADANDISGSIKRKVYLRERLNRASKLLAVSEAFAQIYRQNNYPQTKANRNGIQPFPVLPREKSKSGKVRLAHIGGMAAHKGYFLFQEAVEQANLNNIEVLVINHAQSPGTTEYDNWNGTPVTFLPKFAQEKIHELYSMMDILVAPSMWPESFGLVTREAVAAGVWVIASDKGAIGEDIDEGKNGNIVSVHEPTCMAQLLQKIDRDHLLYQQPNVQGGKTRTTQEQVEELVVLYTKCLRADLS